MHNDATNHFKTEFFRSVGVCADQSVSHPNTRCDSGVIADPQEKNISLKRAAKLVVTSEPRRGKKAVGARSDLVQIVTNDFKTEL